MPIDRFNMDGVGDLELFKAEARRLQAMSGVDPDDCIEIVECDVVAWDGRTPLRLFLGSLAARRFSTPPRGTKLHGTRLHDERYHFGTVVAVHPEIAEVISAYAADGVREIDEGNESRGEWMADTLEGVLSGSINWMFNRHGDAMTIGELDVFHPRQNELLAIEHEHQQKIWQINS